MRFANPLLPDTRSEVALPLLLGDQVLGVLDVQSTQAAAFDETSTAVLQNMADQIAVALNNAAQYRREQARGQQASSLTRSFARVNGAGRSHPGVQSHCRAATSLFACDGAALWLPVGGDEIELQFTINVGAVDMIGHRLRRGEGLSGRVYETGATLRIDDYLTWRGHSTTFADAPFHAALACRS